MKIIVFQLMNYTFDVSPANEFAALRAQMEELKLLIKYPQTDDVTAASGDQSGSVVSPERVFFTLIFPSIDVN